jgi:hypothetical protein
MASQMRKPNPSCPAGLPVSDAGSCDDLVALTASFKDTDRAQRELADEMAAAAAVDHLPTRHRPLARGLLSRMRSRWA